MQKEWGDSWSATRCHFEVLRIIKSTPQGIERSAAIERLERLEPERGRDVTLVTMPYLRVKSRETRALLCNGSHRLRRTLPPTHSKSGSGKRRISCALTPD